MPPGRLGAECPRHVWSSRMGWPRRGCAKKPVLVPIHGAAGCMLIEKEAKRATQN